MSGHQLQGQEAAFGVDLSEAFGDFGTKVAYTNLGLFLISKPDPVLLISVCSHTSIVDIRSFLH